MELDDGMNKEAWRQAWEYRGRQDRERAAKVRASELERGLLATVILDRHARDPLFAKVNADYFSSRPHTHLWRAIKAMHEREAHIERATLLDTLVEYDGLLDALGGEHELDALADGDLVLEDWREGARLFADREWSHSTAAELEAADVGSRCGSPGGRAQGSRPAGPPAAPRSAHLPVWAPNSLRSRKSSNITAAQGGRFGGSDAI